MQSMHKYDGLMIKYASGEVRKCPMQMPPPESGDFKSMEKHLLLSIHRRSEEFHFDEIYGSNSTTNTSTKFHF